MALGGRDLLDALLADAEQAQWRYAAWERAFRLAGNLLKRHGADRLDDLPSEAQWALDLAIRDAEKLGRVDGVTLGLSKNNGVRAHSRGIPAPTNVLTPPPEIWDDVRSKVRSWILDMSHQADSRPNARAIVEGRGK